MLCYSSWLPFLRCAAFIMIASCSTSNATDDENAIGGRDLRGDEEEVIASACRCFSQAFPFSNARVLSLPIRSVLGEEVDRKCEFMVVIVEGERNPV